MNLSKINKNILTLLIFILSAYVVAAEAEISVLATNSWTAAFVEMAGGKAEQLAPASMEHPPEYELKPSDVKKVRDAELLVYAGYEVLMKTVFDSFGKPEDQLVKILTSYSPAAVENSVLQIAEKLGTAALAEQNIDVYKQQVADAREKLKAEGLFGAPVLVQFHQKPLIQALGFDIIGVFGPQPLEVRQIAEFSKTKPRIIIDNAHNPMAAPLTEILEVKVVELINFPGYLIGNGKSAPSTLNGVLRYNVYELTK